MRISTALLACSFLPALACATSDTRGSVQADPPPNRYAFSSGGFLPEGDPGDRGVAPKGGVIELEATSRVALRGDPSMPLEGTAVWLTPKDGGTASKLVVVIDRAYPGAYEVELASDCASLSEGSMRSEAFVGEVVVGEDGVGRLETVLATERPIASPAIMVRRSGTQAVDIASGNVPGVIACSVMPVPAGEDDELAG